MYHLRIKDSTVNLFRKGTYYERENIKIKGMRVPGLFIWLHGFFQGRITKTATVDEETGWISSSYVTSKHKLFNELSAKRVKKLEQELKAVRHGEF